MNDEKKTWQSQGRGLNMGFKQKIRELIKLTPSPLQTQTSVRVSKRLPDRFLKIPLDLEICQASPTTTEIKTANQIRKEFLLQGKSLPYMPDIIRAFRLIKNCKVYLEIGTEDKGNLAYVSQLLDDEATIVDVDIEERAQQKEKLENYLKPSQKLVSIVGDSSALETFEKVKDSLGNEKLDAFFIDGNHSAQYVIADFSHYSSLLDENGFVLFHDIYWQGNANNKGTSEAMECLDKLYPIYSIVYDNVPIHRFLPHQWIGDIWGCIGITSPKWYANE